MKSIVSANYLDRRSKDKWLVRDSSEKVKKAQAFSSVKAIGVKFTYSYAPEQGFGCSIIALCDSVETENPQMPTGDSVRALKAKSLYFSFDRFLDSDGKIVDGCKILFLAPDGSMTAYV